MGKTEVILLIAAVLIVLVYTAVMSRRKREKDLQRKVRESFGTYGDREYTDVDAERITYSYRKEKENGFSLDDITWNDLQMDGIYAQADRCFSVLGESVLYRMLRRPVTDPAVLAERDRVASWFSEHPKEREQLSLLFARIGRGGKQSLWESLDHLIDLESFPVLPDVLCLAGIAAGLVLAVVRPSAFIILPVFAVVVSILLYYRRKARIEHYYSCINAVLLTVRAAEEASRLDAPELGEYLARLSDAVRPLASIRAKASLLGTANRVSGSLEAILMDYVRMLTHVDLLAFSSVLGQVRAHRDEVLTLMETLGFLESMICVSSLRAAMPVWARPQFTEGEEDRFTVRGLYHPFLPDGVRNSFSASRPVLITGSNASGKSTFIKACALSAVLAQTIATVPAESYRAHPYHVYTSMALRDDIAARESYFVVEIRSLYRILKAQEGSTEVLAFVDEVLRGTNTVERVAASAQILRYMAGRRGLTFAATHDIELTNLLQPAYENVHFTETVTEESVTFPYLLQAGPATSRNAIRLLTVMGYPAEITAAAEQAAEHFLSTGKWEKPEEEA